MKLKWPVVPVQPWNRFFLYIICPTILLYSGLFLKQKFLQKRQNLNFEELKFQRLQILKDFIKYNYNFGFIRNSYACSNYQNGICNHLHSAWLSYLQRFGELKLVQNRLVCSSQILVKIIMSWPS